MSDVNIADIFLPINLWIANAELVHEDFQSDGAGGFDRPRIQNLKDIQTEGVSLQDYFDDETMEFNEMRSLVEVPVLTAIGPQTRTVASLQGATEINIPISAFTYTAEALMQGLDPNNDINNAADVRYDNQGYTDNAGTPDPNATFDKVATILDRVESIDTINYTLLAQVSPADPTLGDKYVLAPKLTVNKEEISHAIQSDYYKETIALKSNVLTDAELTRWQNILPSIKKSIGFYTFHLTTPVS